MCLPVCARARETDVVVNASLSEQSLPPIKDYRHIKAIAESTHGQFQMPPSSNDVAKHYNFTACRLKSSPCTGSSQVSLLFFSCMWGKLKRKPPATCSTHAHLSHTNKHV